MLKSNNIFQKNLPKNFFINVGLLFKKVNLLLKKLLLSYAGELHLVHYNSDTYPGGFAEAAPHPDGIAVMAVLCRQENEKTNAAEGDRLINVQI